MKWALLVVGILGALVLGSLLYLSWGIAGLDEECSFSTDCKLGRCETVQYDPNNLGTVAIKTRCVLDCSPTEPCPDGFVCTDIVVTKTSGGRETSRKTEHYCLRPTAPGKAKP